MDFGELAENLNEFIENNSEKPKDLDLRSLDEFLYSIGETYNWPDSVDSVSREQAILCWRIVESLRKTKMSDDLKI